MDVPNMRKKDVGARTMSSGSSDIPHPAPRGVQNLIASAATASLIRMCIEYKCGRASSQTTLPAIVAAQLEDQQPTQNKK
jgi:hypothetical protein